MPRYMRIKNLLGIFTGLGFAKRDGRRARWEDAGFVADPDYLSIDDRTSLFTDAQSDDVRLDGIHAEYVSHFSTSPTGWEVPIDSGIYLAGTNSVLRNSTIAFSAGHGVWPCKPRGCGCGGCGENASRIRPGARASCAMNWSLVSDARARRHWPRSAAGCKVLA